MIKKLLYRFYKEERGSVLVLVAITMFALIGITAVAIDGGRLYQEKSMLQKAADGAALAGAQELPNDLTEAEKFAKEIAKENDVPEENLTIEFASDNLWIKVTTSSIVELTFAKIFGYSSVPVKASAKAELQPLSSGTGVIPIGIDFKDYDQWKNCSSVALKLPSPSNNSNSNPIQGCNGNSNLGSGNTGPLVLTGPGAADYRTDLKEGSKRTISVGEILDTQTGNIVGPTIVAIEYRINSCPNYTYNSETFTTNPPPVDCKRVVTVPVYTITEGDENQIKQVQVVGFATFFIIDVAKPNQGAEVTFRFMNFTTSGGSSSTQTNYGTYGLKLVE